MPGEKIVLLMILAFVCECVDSTLGMGYGTTLTPVLLTLGFEPIVIVPAVLFSEAITGILAGICHHEFGNVNLRPGTRDFKIFLVLSGLSLDGVLVAVLIAVNLPAWVVKLYIGILVLGLGVGILKNHRKEMEFSWRRIAGLGWLAAFNKGISGGGYGPVVTSGQVLAGVRGSTAVGIASLAEGLTSVLGVIIYLLSGASIAWSLALPLVIGAVLSVPLSAYVVSRLPTGRLAFLIGGVSTALGSYTLISLIS